MNIKKQIELDYKIAIQSKSNIVKYALDDFMFILNKLNNDDDIFEKIENIIEERGQKIMRNIKRNKTSIIETDIFVMNLFNQYLSRFKFNKTRRIILKSDDNNPYSNQENWDKNYEVEPKIIQSKRVKLMKIFKSFIKK